MRIRNFWAALAFVAPVSAWGQCGAGETAVTFDIDTDAWGYEVYWEIVPTGNGCGVGTVASGGNPDVGCLEAGGGTGTTYGNNMVIAEGPFCLTTGAAYDFHHIDEYGDGGTTFVLYMEGVFAGSWQGTGDGNVWSFTAGESMLIDHDTPCAAMPVEVDNGIYTINNTGGTVEPGEPTPGAAVTGSCALPGAWCGSDGNVARSVWMTFVAPSNDPVEVTTCVDNSEFDTQLAIYEVGDCADFATYTLIAANDDVPGGCSAANGYSSTTRTSCLTAGETYYIQLDGWAGANGEAKVELYSVDGAEESGLLAQIRNIQCPLDKETLPNGILAAYVTPNVSDFAITWSGPNGFTSNESVLTDLNAGTYQATAITACGNTFAATFNITAPQPWSVSTDVVDATCEMAANGTAALDVTGATGPYEFAWNGPGLDDAPGAEQDSLLAGTYQITITDNNGCTYPSTIVVEGASAQDFTIGADTTICPDEFLLISAPPGYDYAWNDGSINQYFYVQPGDYEPGTYSIIVTASDDAGCEFADAMILTVFDCSTGVDGLSSEQPEIYPVPATDRLNVSGIPSGAQVWITDAAGRRVWSQENVNGAALTLDVANWATGAYIFSGVAEGGAFHMQFQVVD